MDVCSAAKATMQKVSVSAGTGAAFRVRDRRSFLRLVACQACVAPLGELPPPEPVRRAEMDALMHGGSNACNGTKDSHRVYVRSGGGMIKALDCEPELDPKPKVCSPFPFSLSFLSNLLFNLMGSDKIVIYLPYVFSIPEQQSVVHCESA